jgi:hypothetical protein
MTKSKPQVKIVNCETGEEIVRDATANEIAEIELREQNAIAEKAEAEARATQKAALLDRLGITEDEARLLLG